MALFIKEKAEYPVYIPAERIEKRLRSVWSCLQDRVIAKDRVLAHNPVGALYQARAYYSKLTEE